MRHEDFRAESRNDKAMINAKGDSATGNHSKAFVALRALVTASSGSMAVAHTFLVGLLVIGLNVLTGVVTARALAPAGRAEQAAILIGLNLFPYIFSFGLGAAIQFKMRTEPERRELTVSAATLLSIVLGLLSVVAGVVVLPRLITHYSSSVLFLAQAFMLIAPFAILNLVFCGILQARNQFAEVNFTRYAMPLGTLIALVVLALVHRLTPLTSSLAYAATNLLIAPWLWSKVRPQATLRDFGSVARGLLSYGSRTVANQILGTLSVQIDQILVIGLLAPVSMGIYTVALSAARISDLLSGPVVLVLFPKASALPPAEIVELTTRVTRLAVAFSVPMMIAIVAVLPFLLPRVYGRAYVDAVPIAQVLVVSFAISGMVYIVSQAFMASGKPGLFALIQTIGIATAIPAMILLVPHFGLLGAASGLVMSSVLRLCMALVLFPVALKARIPSLIATAADFRFLKATLSSRMFRQAA
jgi:O-antigen/teichoic acid export membrane protein